MGNDGYHIFSNGESLSEYRKFAIRAARELMYDEGYIRQIKNASSESEIARIMHTACERSCEEGY